MTLPSLTGLSMGWFVPAFVAFLLFAAWGMGRLETRFADLRPAC
jgi:Na+-transporting methylmalonyl-CoA/oxaloacetate decarboxylase gamma subunit